jgi:hypothetical protein
MGRALGKEKMGEGEGRHYCRRSMEERAPSLGCEAYGWGRDHRAPLSVRKTRPALER